MLTANALAKSYGGQTLFRDATLQLLPGNRIGLVGANGSGKSTLLRILSAQEESDAGEVVLARRARLAFLEQDHFEYDTTPILDVVMMGHRPLWKAIQDKDALLENASEEFDADRYGELEEFIVQNDGYALEARAAEILEGLSIPTAAHFQPLSTLSGGFKLRVLLGQTLCAVPEVLLLDEPTNHLDILSIRWLERFLVGFKGAVAVVSHDHRFLNNVCTHIADVDYERVTLYRGNYEAFERAKQEERERREEEIRKREGEIAHHRAFVEKFKAKPTKARQAKSKAKQIERVQIDKLPPSSRRYPKFRFESRRPSGRQVAKLTGIAKRYGDKQVLEGVDLQVRRGDRLAVIGPNGIGKSTLLKILLERVEPDEGAVEWGYETHPGYFAQDHHELLKGNDTLQSWLWNLCGGETVGFVRSQLARVLFSKDEVEKRIGYLSGGEAARLVFAGLAVTKPNVLVLDEPTNHLDLEGIEALAEALVQYDGTLIFVSHDRWFVGRVASRILEIRSDGIEDFDGSYEEYLERCGDDHLDAEAVLQRAREARRRKKSARQKR